MGERGQYWTHRVAGWLKHGWWAGALGSGSEYLFPHDYVCVHMSVHMSTYLLRYIYHDIAVASRSTAAGLNPSSPLPLLDASTLPLTLTTSCCICAAAMH